MSVCGEFGRRRSKMRSPARREAVGKDDGKEDAADMARKGLGIMPILIGLGVLLAAMAFIGGGKGQ